MGWGSFFRKSQVSVRAPVTLSGISYYGEAGGAVAVYHAEAYDHVRVLGPVTHGAHFPYDSHIIRLTRPIVELLLDFNAIGECDTTAVAYIISVVRQTNPQTVCISGGDRLRHIVEVCDLSSRLHVITPGRSFPWPVVDGRVRLVG